MIELNPRMPPLDRIETLSRGRDHYRTHVGATCVSALGTDGPFDSAQGWRRSAPTIANCLLLGLPAMHRDIDQLPHRIMHAHLGEAAIFWFYFGVGFRAGGLGAF